MKFKQIRQVNAQATTVVKTGSFLRNKILYFSFFIFLFLLLFPFFTYSANKKADFVGDFETGDFSQWGGNKYSLNQDSGASRMEIVTSPVRAGNYAVKTILRTRPGYENTQPLSLQECLAKEQKEGRQWKERAEVVRYEKEDRGDEKWYGFSIMIPKETKKFNEYFEVLAQWHGDDIDVPPLGVYYDKEGIISVKGGRDRGEIWEGPIKKGEWLDFVFHIIWQPDNSGYLQVWLNGKKIIDEYGATCNPKKYKDGKPVLGWRSYKTYFKMGGYRGRCVIGNQVFYHDEFRVGDSYQAVAPPGSPVPVTYCGDGICDRNETKSSCPKDCSFSSDLNQDGKINIQDLGIILSYWGKTDRERCDINRDGKTDSGDAIILLSKL